MGREHVSVGAPGTTVGIRRQKGPIFALAPKGRRKLTSDEDRRTLTPWITAS